MNKKVVVVALLCSLTFSIVYACAGIALQRATLTKPLGDPITDPRPTLLGDPIHDPRPALLGDPITDPRPCLV